MSFGTFFLPGPTEVRPEVLAAMTRPMIPHRGAEFEALFRGVQRGLRFVFGTERPVYITTSSATGLMEAAARCAAPGRVLSLVNGAFSERFAAIATACGREVDRYEVAWGEVHDPAEVATRLRARAYAAVTVAHSETSTGALNDVRAISDVAHEAGVRCLIDSVSGLGGAELRFEAWGLDYVFTGSQKALALPPGLAFAVATEDVLADAARAPNRGAYFDLVEIDAFTRKHQAPNTPAISLYYALERQLSDVTLGGMPARWARHSAMAMRTAAWVGEMRDALGADLRVLAPEGHRSPTVTTVVLPPPVGGDALVAAVAERGITIGAGYGKLKATTVRVGHMGDHTPETLERCLSACADALHELVKRA